MKLTHRELIISLAFNVGIGFFKKTIIIKGEHKINIKTFLLPFLYFTYIECFIYNDSN